MVTVSNSTFSTNRLHHAMGIEDIFTLCASCSAVYCNRSCLFVYVCFWDCNHDNSKLHASNLTKLGLYIKVCDHLQLIKFWPSHTPGKWVCGGAKIYGLALLQPAHSVYVSLSTCFMLFRAGTNTQYQYVNSLAPPDFNEFAVK